MSCSYRKIGPDSVSRLRIILFDRSTTKMHYAANARWMIRRSRVYALEMIIDIPVLYEYRMRNSRSIREFIMEISMIIIIIIIQNNLHDLWKGRGPNV